MEIGILGTGMVGQTMGDKFVQLGHEVVMGSRSKTNEKAAEWASRNGEKASSGEFSDAAAFGEIIFNCVKGEGALAALGMIGSEMLAGKILVDVSNPLDFSRGMPPSLLVCNTDSLGEQIQQQFPDTSVVKAFNTLTAELMVNPGKLPGDHDLFICGNDKDAKEKLTAFLRSEIGWKSIIDLGGIESARGMEMLLPLWVNLYAHFQTANFNFKIVRR
jgi:NADPH-dependent F420 reductase